MFILHACFHQWANPAGVRNDERNHNWQREGPWDDGVPLAEFIARTRGPYEETCQPNESDPFMRMV